MDLGLTFKLEVINEYQVAYILLAAFECILSFCVSEDQYYYYQEQYKNQQEQVVRPDDAPHNFHF